MNKKCLSDEGKNMKNSSVKSNSSGKGSKTKAILTTLFNPRAWSDWDRSKSSALYVTDMLKRMFVIKKGPNNKSESFAKIVNKFDLDETMLEAKAKGLLRTSYALLAMSVLILIYGLYQFCFGSLIGALIAMVEVGIGLVLSFRYHFWQFQIKQRKLGCTVKHWFNDTFKGEHS